MNVFYLLKYISKNSNNMSKVQNIETRGYYVRFNDFVEMTVSRSIIGVNFNNTI